jgi:prepilin-type processing-associated H-X9-DG protein
LIELLVVISIIALLLAMLMPGLNKAREMGRRVQCGSSLHQLMLAWLMYSESNNGVVIPGKDYNKYPGSNLFQFWNGKWVTDSSKPGGGYLIPEEGYLWKYAQSGKLNACPSFKKVMTLADHGQLGYGYNFRYLSPQGDKAENGFYPNYPTKLVGISQPSRKMAFADCARNQKNAALGFPQEMTPFVPPPRQQYPGFQGRHSKTGNVGWIDGHVSIEVPKFLRTIYNINRSTPVMEARYAKYLNVGDIDSDGDPETDELFSTYTVQCAP